MPTASLTSTTYTGLQGAYDFFNKRLFQGRLPRCLVTLQRKSKTYGYFAPTRFSVVADDTKTDEIALNPSHFVRGTRDVLATLVHEMTHLEQQHFGKPSRTGYHNAEWGTLMDRVGLMPTDTGEPGGKRVGQRVTHMIVAGGPFDRACDALLGSGYVLPVVELWGDEQKAKAKAKQRVKYSCSSCAAAAWGKPGLRISCTECDLEMSPGGDSEAAEGVDLAA